MHLRHIMLYCFKKDNSANDTADKIYIVYGSDAIIHTIIRNWSKRFRSSNFDLKDKDRSGCSATTNTDFYQSHAR